MARTTKDARDRALELQAQGPDGLPFGYFLTLAEIELYPEMLTEETDV